MYAWQCRYNGSCTGVMYRTMMGVSHRISAFVTKNWWNGIHPCDLRPMLAFFNMKKDKNDENVPKIVFFKKPEKNPELSVFSRISAVSWWQIMPEYWKLLELPHTYICWPYIDWKILLRQICVQQRPLHLVSTLPTSGKPFPNYFRNSVGYLNSTSIKQKKAHRQHSVWNPDIHIHCTGLFLHCSPFHVANAAVLARLWT